MEEGTRMRRRIQEVLRDAHQSAFRLKVRRRAQSSAEPAQVGKVERPRDTLSKWKGNPHRRAELCEHLRAAKDGNAAIKLVIAHPAPIAAELVGNVPDKSELN